MVEWLVESKGDRYWIGRILFLRRKIQHLCLSHGNISRASVLAIIDDVLPEIDKEDKDGKRTDAD